MKLIGTLELAPLTTPPTVTEGGFYYDSVDETYYGSTDGIIWTPFAGGNLLGDPVTIAHGGTNATNASDARTSLGAATSGANSDITSLSGLTTPLSVAQGGTNASTTAGARTAISAAKSGANSDITSILGLTGKLYFDGGVDTYITETSADLLEFYVGGNLALSINGTTSARFRNIPIVVDPNEKIYFDGGVDTYITEIVADTMRIVAGASTAADFRAASSEFYGDLFINATKKFYLDGGVNSYIYESSPDNISLVVGGVTVFEAVTTALVLSSTIDLALFPAKKFYIDGGVDTYIDQPANDQMRFTTGGVERFSLEADGTGTFAGQVLFPATDPPAANYVSRQGPAKAWIQYTDNSATVAGSYNFQSIGDDDGDGQYNLNFDTNFASTYYTAVGNTFDPANVRDIVTFFTSTAGTIVMNIWNEAAGTNVDRSFMAVAFGDQ